MTYMYSVYSLWGYELNILIPREDFDGQAQMPDTISAQKPMSKYSFIISLFLATLFGMSLSYGYFFFSTKAEIGNVIRLPNNKFQYINPLLDTLNPNTTLPKDVRATEEKIKVLIEQKQNNGDIQRASIFFRDLNNGPHFSINHDELYTPASLLKLPILIAYLKETENDPNILNTSINYPAQLEAPNFPHNTENATIAPDQEYTVLELLEAMTHHSDNEATILLLDNIDGVKIDQVYDDLSVPLQPLLNVYKPFITASQYASFFRILYNATYLSKQSSELALAMLTKTSFTEGLRKPLPKEIPVASKFGVFETDTATNFHECGIIYTKNPYLLCVMTKGNDYQRQEKVIAEISKLVYEGLVEI